MPYPTVNLKEQGSSPLPTAHLTELPAVIEWSAPEHIMYEYGRRWHMTIGGITVLLILWGIFSHNYFFLAFVVLALATTLFYTKRKPRIIACALEEDAMRFGSQRHRFAELKSFWIFDHGFAQELSLETGKTLDPFIRIPLGEINAHDLRSVLLRHLPEKEQKESASDQLARSLGF